VKKCMCWCFMHYWTKVTFTPPPCYLDQIQKALLLGIRRLERQSDLSHPSSAIIKNTWSCTSMPSISFTFCAYHNNTCISLNKGEGHPVKWLGRHRRQAGIKFQPIRNLGTMTGRAFSNTPRPLYPRRRPDTQYTEG